MPGSAPKSDCAAAEEGDPCFYAPSLCPKDAPLTAIATTWFSNASNPCEVGTYCSVYIEALRVWALSVHLNNPCKRSVVLFMHQQQVIPTLLQEVISDLESAVVGIEDGITAMSDNLAIIGADIADLREQSNAQNRAARSELAALRDVLQALSVEVGKLAARGAQ